MFIGSIGIKQDIDQDSLVRLVKSAWIRLRFTAPWLAVRTSVVKGENSKSNSFMYTYDASNNPQKTADWADETVISERRTQSLDEWELEIKDRFWTPNENRFGMELHIAPDVDKKWFFMFVIPCLSIISWADNLTVKIQLYNGTLVHSNPQFHSARMLI